jgi:hypothetical protein
MRYGKMGGGEMTRARAIEWLKEIKIAYKYSEQEKAIAFAISVLERVTEERIDDIITRHKGWSIDDLDKTLCVAIVKELGGD